MEPGSRKIKRKLADCTKFIQRDMDVTGLGFMRKKHHLNKIPLFVIQPQNVEFNPIGRNGLIGTGDNLEDKSQYYGEVVDMEKLFSAKVCYLHDVPFISFKYITDGGR